MHRRIPGNAPPHGAVAAWSLPVYLLLGLLLRLPAVLCADGYHFVDQQVQYIDPAWHLATGGAWYEPWESIDGVRSHVYPELLASLFRGVLALGLDAPMWQMRAVRMVHALASLLPLALFWLVLVRWYPQPRTRLPLLLFAGSGLLVTIGVQPSAPTLGATLAVAAALAVHGPRGFPLFGGLCLGFAFCCRFQEALFGPALLVALLAQRRWAAAVGFAFGCVPGIVVQGLQDLQHHGVFLATPWKYVDTNLNGGAAAKFGQEPWWFYAVIAVPLLALVPPWSGAAWRRVVVGAGVLPGAAAAALLHLAVHSLLGRKAFRFEQGAFALLVAVVAVGIAAAAVEPRRGRWHERALVAVHGAFLLYASFWFGNAGAVRMAEALRGDPGLAHEVLVVGGDATSLGGFFYLRPPACRVAAVPERGDLPARLRDAPPAVGALVVAVREPLAVGPGTELERLEPVGTFPGMFDRSAGERRFVYRWR